MKDTLRFIACGSVDDGKSTLIGRLLFDARQIFEDQFSSVQRDSARYGTRGDAVDLALLTDGLQAEREQGITIDVAYRYFATPQRRFVAADTPGHEQYTRNMATAASTADAAVLLIDARKGLLIQTWRHSRIAALLGVRHLVVAVNKMDLVAWDEAPFRRLQQECRALADTLGFVTLQTIPVCALGGENILQASRRTPWYSGPALLPCLEALDVADSAAALPLRMPVQWVNRPGPGFRGYCGRIASGVVSVGDAVRIMPGERATRVKSIVKWHCEPASATAGESITLCLADEVDVSRGDVIAAAQSPVAVSDQFEAHVICLSGQRLVAGRQYAFRLHTCEAGATVTAIKFRIDVNSGAHLAAKGLGLNEIGVVNLSTDRPVAFEPYTDLKTLGAFILIDRLTNETIAAGMIAFALRRAANIRWQALDVGQAERARQKLQKPACIWLTGLSGAGKSTIANLLDKRLYTLGRHTYVLDGDNVRHGLNRDLGFTESDRIENIRRVADVARLMVDAGLIVIVAFISPFRAERGQARARFHPGEFCEVFIDTPLAECERRDTKGLYAKARSGVLKNFTGIDSPYEYPETPDMRIDTTACTPEEAVKQIVEVLGM